jgi:hypothetical protein
MFKRKEKEILFYPPKELSEKDIEDLIQNLSSKDVDLPLRRLLLDDYIKRSKEYGGGSSSSPLSSS